MTSTIFLPNAQVNEITKRELSVIWCAILVLAWLILPSKIIPSPLAIVSALPRLWMEDGLGGELWTSLSLNFQAAICMIVISLLVAYATTIPAFRPLGPAFSAGRFNSFVGLPLLLTLLIGNAHVIKVTLLTIAMSVFTVPAVIDIIGTIPREAYDDARTLRMSEWRVMVEVSIFSKFHEVIDVLRTNLAVGWMLLPMVEGLFRSEGGIGVMLLVENKYLRLDSVYCLILVVALIGLAQDRAILWIKKQVCPYSFIEGVNA